MSSRLPRLTVVALATAVGLFSFASAAHATPPTRETFHDEGFLTLPDFDCGRFTLHEEMISEERTVTTFYDEQGDVERVQTHTTFLGEITNSATGETFRDHAVANVVTEADLTISAGVGFNLVRQGQGAIMQLIGRRIETDEGGITLAGPDDVQGDLQTAICAALA